MKSNGGYTDGSLVWVDRDYDARRLRFTAARVLGFERTRDPFMLSTPALVALTIAEFAPRDRDLTPFELASALWGLSCEFDRA